MKHKKLLQAVLCLAVAISFIVSVTFSVYAADSNELIINYDDYAHYSLSDTDGIWNMTAAFPSNWSATIVQSVWDETEYKGNEFVYDMLYLTPGGSVVPGMQFTITPLGIDPVLYLNSSLEYTNLRLLDTSLIPNSASLEFSFDIVISSLIGSESDALASLGDIRFYVAFFRESISGGWFELVYSDDWFAQVELFVDAFYIVHITTRFSLSDYPEYSNLSFAPFIQITDFTGFYQTHMVDGEAYARIRFTYDSLTMQFPVSDAVKLAQDSARGDKLLSNIGQALADQGQQIDDFLNNEIELDQGEVGGAVGDLDSSEDALLDKVGGYLGEAGSLFSSIVSDLTQFAPAFAAVALVFNEFVSIPFIGFLLRISILLGILAVALNISISAERAGYWIKGKKAEQHRKNHPVGFKYD